MKFIKFIAKQSYPADCCGYSLFWQRRGLIPRLRRAGWFIPLLIIAGGICYGGAPEENTPPGHNYVLLTSSSRRKQSARLGSIRDSLMKSLLLSGILPEGYPKPGRLITRIKDKKNNLMETVCVKAEKAGKSSCGIILDGKGSFIQLSFVDYPDSRAYLFEIYLPEHYSGGRAPFSEMRKVPRIAVHYPVFRKDYSDDITGILDKGLLRAGAGKIKIYQSGNSAGEEVLKACYEISQMVKDVPGTAISFNNCSFTDDIAGCERTGREIIIEGSFKNLGGADEPAALLHETLPRKGWEELLSYSANGPDGTAFAFQKRNIICIVNGELGGGADDDPSYVPSEFYKVMIKCAKLQ